LRFGFFNVWLIAWVYHKVIKLIGFSFLYLGRTWFCLSLCYLTARIMGTSFVLEIFYGSSGLCWGAFLFSKLPEVFSWLLDCRIINALLMITFCFDISQMTPLTIAFCKSLVINLSSGISLIAKPYPWLAFWNSHRLAYKYDLIELIHVDCYSSYSSASQFLWSSNYLACAFWPPFSWFYIFLTLFFWNF